MKTLLSKISATFLILVVMSATLFALTGCNTTAGMGKDIEAAGEAINEEAEEKKNY
ncbi:MULTISPECIES: entericidin A/B family lipoprotein [Sedimenticola]|uniref:entericidin A/B family lipoprotein n=1 Tax=Sedimenticola TaxID=349742 RepID=UPI0004AE5E52|nr:MULTISPECIES: entericidin A/B family lipoprotein [Sedimenticola]MCW8905417.1 entericidin A/B family lipoprotein [Sedimenticola sp.]